VAASLLYALPPIVLFFAVRRYIAAGLTRGAVKG
jgi:ABC-type maltose transport system permease subunit